MPNTDGAIGSQTFQMISNVYLVLESVSLKEWTNPGLFCLFSFFNNNFCRNMEEFSGFRTWIVKYADHLTTTTARNSLCFTELRSFTRFEALIYGRLTLSVTMGFELEVALVIITLGSVHTHAGNISIKRYFDLQIVLS